MGLWLSMRDWGRNCCSLELRARHKVLKKVAKIGWMVREADDWTVVERLGCICGTGGKHIRKHGGVLRQEIPVDAECSIAGEEDEIAVIKPEVGMTSEFFLTTGKLGRVSGGDDDEWIRTAGDATAFGRAGIESHILVDRGIRNRVAL